MTDKPRTPRDWLLHRHAGARPRLDAIRASVLPEPKITWPQFLGHVFIERRVYWSALAAVWIAIATLQLTRDFSPRNRDTVDSVPQATIALWLRQHDPHATIASISYYR